MTFCGGEEVKGEERGLKFTLLIYTVFHVLDVF